MKVAMKGNDKVPIRLLFAFSKQKWFRVTQLRLSCLSNFQKCCCTSHTVSNLAVYLVDHYVEGSHESYRQFDLVDDHE